MADFKLSALLKGHDDDVRAVAFPSPSTVLTASRDATVRIWKELLEPAKSFDATILSHGSGFKNSLAYLGPSKDFPEGLVVSGGQDSIIEIRQPSSKSEDNAEALLLGHAHNVCSIDVEPSGAYIISGGWDSQARIWRVGKWETEALLEGHEGSVWAVLAWDEKTVVTGCADHKIRIFSTSGKLIRIIKDCSDVIRALCRLPTDHPSGASFASASNDGMIRLFTLEGVQMAVFQAHESFIYSLATLPSGELVSAGEDRTVRIWSGTKCLQTITHPAISVWSVAVCSKNGDIVSGASDKIARIFTRDKNRFASEATLAAFDESVKASSIPQQQLGQVNKEKLPGPEFLIQKSGTKEGQVVMIKQANGNVTAHQWSMGNQQWIDVGTVVDAVGSSGKKHDYLGQDYDYVFDVDIAEGQPALKLPYNLSQNPYEAATKFIQDNELPMTYLDQVANFITTNTQGATIGQSQAQPDSSSDPWGMESRYRPGETASSQPGLGSSAPRPKVIPQTTYLSISQANLKAILKKIMELNHVFVKNNDKEQVLTSSDLAVLEKIISLYETSTGAATDQERVLSGLPVVLKICAQWPAANRLPGLDLLRLIATKWPAVGSFRGSGDQSVITILNGSANFTDKEYPNNTMLALRTLANLFESEEGRNLADQQFNQVLEIAKPLAGASPNRNLTIALTTLLINYSVLLTSSTFKGLPTSADRAISLLDLLTAIIKQVKDSEAVYRALVASGTFLTLGEEVQEAAKSVYDLGSAAKIAAKSAKEPRIKGVVEEIQQLLES